MATFVLKIKYGDVLRRVTVPERFNTGEPNMTYSKLVDTIRQTFKLPASTEVVVTYTDNDNDVVTMTGDHDLHDAFILQGLNPLRLTVTTTSVANTESPVTPAAAPTPVTFQAPAPPTPGRWGPHGRHGRHGRPQNLPDVKNFLDSTMKFSQETAKQTADHVQQVLHACEPLIRGAPKMVVSEVVESLIKAFSSQPAAGPAVPKEKEDLSEPLLGPLHQFGRSTFGVCPMVPNLSCPAPAPPAPPTPSPIGPHSGEGEVGMRFARPMPSADVKDDVRHDGVQCDMCKACPIVGTRYKSNKHPDYDLCRDCFQEHGSVEDYTQIDRPIWRPRSFGGGRMMRCPAVPSYYGARPHVYMRGPHMHGGHHSPYGGKGDSRCGGPFGSGGGAGGKLDARFVQDVTIFDGTELAPGTPFTKIWRLRNSGTFSWPKSTQLVHVGGDELGSVFAVTVELPEHGLAPDEEVEVSVDLVAPEKPGRYVSHWRLVSPAGQKFGHRVWVLIQVVPKDEQSPQMLESLIASQEGDEELEEPERLRNVDLRSEVLRSEESVTSAPTLTDLLGTEETEAAQPEDEISSAAVHVVDDLITLDSEIPEEQKPQVDAVSVFPGKVEYPEINVQAIPPIQIEESKDFEDDDVKVQEENVAVENSELGNFSMVDMPNVEMAPVTNIAEPDVEAVELPKVIDVQEGSLTEKDRVRSDAEADSVEMMLGTLEAMGFNQRPLNLELLKKNNYDMQRTLDDLVMAAEWDPMLEELEEMGFYDTDMNRRLMFKNNGSVKRVVKELVQMYKDPNPKGKEQM